MVAARDEVVPLDLAPAIEHLLDLRGLRLQRRGGEVPGHQQPVRAAVRLAQVAQHGLEHDHRVGRQARVLLEGRRPVVLDDPALALAHVQVIAERQGEQVPAGRRGEGFERAGVVERAADPDRELHRALLGGLAVGQRRVRVRGAGFEAVHLRVVVGRLGVVLAARS